MMKSEAISRNKSKFQDKITLETGRENIQKLLVGRQTTSTQFFNPSHERKSAFIPGFTGSTISVL